MNNKVTIILYTVFALMLNLSVTYAQSNRYNPSCHTDLYKFTDSTQVDFSSEYKKWLTSDSSQKHEDITRELLKNGYFFENPLFDSERFIYGGASCYYDTTSFNGILGKEYSRIEIFISPKVERKDSLTFKVRGKSKVRNNICDFAGEILIEHIYRIWERANDPDSPVSYLMICNYLLKEDPKQYGTGSFQGTYGVWCYIDEVNKSVCLDIDLGGGDSYDNRNYVGTWKSYKSNAVKKCIWGDYRLPYTFDFDIGDGEIVVNPKYNSPEWEQWKLEYSNLVKKVRWWKNPSN